MHDSPRPRHSGAPLALSALCVLALSLAACDTTRNLMPDQPPTVTLTSGPIDTVSAPQSWLVDISWVGSDPDGRIDHYEYALDPPGLKQARFAQAETAWVKTTDHHVVARFHASHPDSLGPGATAPEFHVFVLRAVDDRGGISPDVVRAFYAYTVAPDVQITRPLPSALLSPQLPVPFRVEWRGHDPDGTGNGQPASYRYRFVSLDAPGIVYLADPDSLLREAFMSDWTGWTILPSDTTSLVVPANLFSPGQSVALAVLAVDDAGATTPYLMLDRNFLQFSVAAPGSGAPIIHLWSTLFDFTYPSGGYSVDPSREIPVQVGANVPFTIYWEGFAQPGRLVAASRWMLDGNVADETPRSGPEDLAHWSAPAAPPADAHISGLTPGVHRIYVEITDDFGGKSLGIVRIDVVVATLTSELLVVDDTRLEVDRFPPGSGGAPSAYTTQWPSRAEMDTFLFAHGGVPWLGTRNPTTGVISPPGLLAGYAFDTLGTRLGFENPAQGVPLSTLGHYRHVIWLVDGRAAFVTPGSPYPTTALSAMSGPGLASALAAYVQLGGQVWLAGGGAAYASLVNFDRRTNNRPTITVFSDSAGELAPGRILYDYAHIRSAIGVTTGVMQVTRSPAAIGGWSGHGPDGTLSAPDYAHAPPSLRPRDPATDPVPPTRLASQGALYYRTSFAAGFVLEPNLITEDFGTPGYPRLESALDTVYDASGAAIPIPAAPVMTYYHGRDNTPFVYTGFEPWDWTRADCQGLVAFVLGDIWKLSKSARAGARPAATSTSRVPPAPTPRMPVRLDPRRMRP